MRGKMNKLVNKVGRESYVDGAAEDATAKYPDNEFEAARAEENAFDAACAEQSTARAHFKRVGDLAWHTMGTSNKRKED